MLSFSRSPISRRHFGSESDGPKFVPPMIWCLSFRFLPTRPPFFQIVLFENDQKLIDYMNEALSKQIRPETSGDTANFLSFTVFLLKEY